MGKALLLSIIFGTIFLPTWAAREKNAAKGFRKAIIRILLLNLFYWFVLMFLFGRF